MVTNRDINLMLYSYNYLIEKPGCSDIYSFSSSDIAKLKNPTAESRERVEKTIASRRKGMRKMVELVGVFEVQALGEFQMFGKTFVVNKCPKKGYTVSELSSGLKVIEYYPTKKKAILIAKSKLLEIGKEEVEEHVARVIKIWGPLNQGYFNEIQDRKKA